MKIASYNIENMFERATILDKDDWAKKNSVAKSRWDGARDALGNWSSLNAILRKEKYSAADKRKILDLLSALGLAKADENDEFILRQNRGHLLKRPRGKPAEVVAGGRGDWVGWVELQKEAVNEAATQNTARVIKAIDADVLAVVEAEDRTTLCRFNEQVLGGKEAGGVPYEHVMLIDGNDDRGIDVGLYTKKDHPVVSICSHVDDKTADGSKIFSRDCPQYEIRLPGGGSFLLLINHLKSKGYGVKAQSDAKRLAQATRVREIYESLRQAGHDRIAVVGDFNDTPDSSPLAPLLTDSDLKDVSEHPAYESDGRIGTFGDGNKSNKIDFILLSPKLFELVKHAGVFRLGVWGGKNGTLFPHLPTITKAEEAASDHAAIWAELGL